METRPDFQPRLLIVDDEVNLLKALVRMLRGQEFELFTAETGTAALSVLEENLIDVMLLDVKLPDLDGIEVLRRAKEIDPETAVIVMTGHGTIMMAVEAIREGAFEFLQKPFESEDLVPLTVRRALTFRASLAENRRLTDMVTGKVQFSNMVSASASMQRLMRLVPRLAEIESTVLITGESGTGKEVLARAIHFNGPRRQRRFVPVDCGAIPEGIIESELFGHLKGTFTGAAQSTVGLIKQADQGTVFFDEIGELPLLMQTKLLRFLQDHEVRPLGGGAAEKVEVRVIVATNKDLKSLVKENRFREDLFYRLNVVNLELPPLRERKEDIPILLRHFMDKHRPRLNQNMSLSPEAFRRLTEYHWPGNVRELENVIIQLLSLCAGDAIQLKDLPSSIREFTPRTQSPVPEEVPLSLTAYEKLAIERALQTCQGSIADAADLLKIGKSTLYRKIKDLGIEPKSVAEKNQP